MKIWTRKESKERFPRAISPLGWSLLQVPLEASLEAMAKSLGVKKYTRDEMILWHNYYVYTRKDFFTNIKNLRFRPLPFAGMLSGIFIAAIKASFLTLLRRRSFKVELALNIYKCLYEAKVQSLISSWPSLVSSFKELMGRDYRLHTVETIDLKRFVEIRKQMQEDSKVFFAEDFNVYFFKNILSSVLKTIYTDQELAKLTAGLSGNFAIEMVEDFNNPQLSTEFLKKKFGHLTNNWDLYGKTLAEEELIWRDRFQKTNSVKKISHECNEHDPYLKKLITQLCELIIMDEDLRAYSSLQYPQARKLMSLVEHTRAWKETGLPDNSIYFLSLNEIENGLESNNFHPFIDPIEKRMKDFNIAMDTDPPFEIIQEGKELSSGQTKPRSNTKELKGTIISPGKIEGIATFIKDYQDLPRLNKDNIIVIESATPVYAPFYMSCGGIISEMGGQLSHGAIVAREYGIPMISDVEDACVLLKNGQRIILDADAGTVRIING